MSERRRVVVVGTGYIGLPVALMLARSGHDVVGVDIDANVVEALNGGDLHLDEDQLRGLMDDPNVRANLSGSHNVVAADVFIVAVPTPLDPVEKHADLSAVCSAIEDVARVAEPGNLIIVESTVPPLTCRNLITPILERHGHRVGEDVQLAHCPERILPGDVFREIVENDRLIGSASEQGRRDASEVYRSFVVGELISTDDVTAELVKLMENTYRDVNIALANELSSVARVVGVDGAEAIRLANMHPRVDLLEPGIGVGGHCIPIDPWFINQVDPTNSSLIRAARRVNDERPGLVAADIRRAVADVVDPLIVVLGASYKPNTSDTRESPAGRIVDELRSDGYQVVWYDPVAGEGQHQQSIAAAAEGADLLVLLVAHDAIVRELGTSMSEIKSRMRRSVLLSFVD